MIKLEDTRRVIAAKEKQAKQIGQPMNIVLAAEGGNLISPILMDGAWRGSIDISIKKTFYIAQPSSISNDAPRGYTDFDPT
jgi:uncharacterized protein GlcG (DUF336 family)